MYELYDRLYFLAPFFGPGSFLTVIALSAICIEILVLGAAYMFSRISGRVNAILFAIGFCCGAMALFMPWFSLSSAIKASALESNLALLPLVGFVLTLQLSH